MIFKTHLSTNRRRTVKRSGFSLEAAFGLPEAEIRAKAGARS